MEKEILSVKLPEGNFSYCTGNCTCCIYYEPRKLNSRGEGWCNYYGTHYYPSSRQGCRSHKCMN